MIDDDEKCPEVTETAFGKPKFLFSSGRKVV